MARALVLKSISIVLPLAGTPVKQTMAFGEMCSLIPKTTSAAPVHSITTSAPCDASSMSVW